MLKSRYPALAGVLVALLLIIALSSPGCRRKHSDWHIGKTAQIVYIDVLSGSEFDIKTADGERVHAILKVGTPPQAKEKVTKLVNKWVHPEVRFLSKVDKGWVVDLEFALPNCNGTICTLGEHSLTDWLKSQGLAWQ